MARNVKTERGRAASEGRKADVMAALVGAGRPLAVVELAGIVPFSAVEVRHAVKDLEQSGYVTREVVAREHEAPAGGFGSAEKGRPWARSYKLPVYSAVLPREGGGGAARQKSGPGG